MAETVGGRIDGDDEHLPWLESAEPDPEPGAPVWRTVLLILVALLAVGAIVFAFLRHRSDPVADGSGDLIQAPAGDYKVRADGSDGMQVAGDGDQVFATSEGGTVNGSVNLRGVPEAPVPTGRQTPAAKSAPVTGSAQVVREVPERAERLQARAPAAAPPAMAAAASGGSVVQLGSFPTEAQANAQWNGLSRRLAYLAPLGKTVQPAEVEGRTVYRLRVNAGSATQAGELCAKLKIAGEACFVAR